jgi:flavorubredoxin
MGPHATRIDHIAGGIHRISTWSPQAGITFNQFLIDDERPALIHTGTFDMYEPVCDAINQVLDPARLALVVLLHWEGDENGGMERLMRQAPAAELVGSALSIALNAHGFGLRTRTQGFTDGQALHLGEHTLRFLETPHVHHWDSMMVVEESTNSLFPSDLYLQPGDQPPVTHDDLAVEMIEHYRGSGVFAHEKPVRDVADRVEQLSPTWVHAMHGATIAGEALPYYTTALREQDFAYRGLLLGRRVAAHTSSSWSD